MNKPLEISIAEWEEIMQVPAIRESWGIQDDDTAEQFAEMVYGVNRYNGDLYILHGDAMASR
jgi:hypothetical protein